MVFHADCEHLIRHMLIVDANKRYSIAQIKQHKWLIQGEPYEDIVDIEEQHKNGNGICIYNEKVLQQMAKLGEDRAKVINVCFCFHGSILLKHRYALRFFSTGFFVYYTFLKSSSSIACKTEILERDVKLIFERT